MIEPKALEHGDEAREVHIGISFVVRDGGAIVDVGREDRFSGSQNWRWSPVDNELPRGILARQPEALRCQDHSPGTNCVAEVKRPLPSHAKSG